MTAVAVRRWQGVANGNHNWGVREMVEAAIAALISAGGWWAFLTRRVELRSTEAQQLRDEAKQLRDDWKEEARLLREEAHRDRETHAAALKEMGEKLLTEREMRFAVESERDTLKADKVWMAAEMTRYMDEIAELKAKIVRNEDEIANNRRELGEHQKRIDEHLRTIAALQLQVTRDEWASRMAGTYRHVERQLEGAASARGEQRAGYAESPEG